MHTTAIRIITLTTLLGTALTQAPTHTSVTQCTCSELDECSSSVLAKTAQCKKNAKCTSFLTQIGDSTKILKCLDNDHQSMYAVDQCVKKKLGGELGCTNSASPVNITVPLIPVIEVPTLEESAAKNAENAASVTPATGAIQAPIQLSQFLMCIDECALDDLDVIPGRKKRNAATCAFKLKCALSPPNETTQKAYADCQKELNYDQEKGAKQSCECLKAAGVAMECP